MKKVKIIATKAAKHLKEGEAYEVTPELAEILIKKKHAKKAE